MDSYPFHSCFFRFGSRYYVIFEILFWTGIREGELLALTKSDVDFQSNRMSITKTYYRTERRDVITVPKTEQSVRVIELPEFLTQEIKEYVDKLYELPDDERIFPIVAEALQHKLKRQAENLFHSFAWIIRQIVDTACMSE